MQLLAITNVAASTRYTAASYDYEGRALASGVRIAAAGIGRTCLPAVAAGAAHDGYTIVRIDIRRGDDHIAPAFIHIARGERGHRVIGIDRR